MYVSGDKEFNNLFFSTPTAYSSVIITDPDLPPLPPNVNEEEETLSEPANFKVDKLKVSAPKVATKAPASSTPKAKAPQTKAPAKAPVAPAPPPPTNSEPYEFFFIF
jgi:uncharacterized Zn-finger protein